MSKKKVPIDLTSRDFRSLRADLIEYAKRYYPNTYKDFNEASFGSLTIDTVAYTGDILSFYLDYQTNESFFDTAVEYNNIIKHGRSRGYKFRGSPSSHGPLTLYVIVPAKAVGLGPDTDYLPILLRGSELASTSGNGYILNENVDFSDPNNEIVVAAADETTGVPTFYAVKAKGQVISGEMVEETFEIGNFEEFRRVPLSGENIAEVMSCIDSEGHDYFEVDYLSQNVVYASAINRSSDSVAAPSVLKPLIVPRRFTVEQDDDSTYLQFGFGSQEEIKLSSVADPSSVVMRVHGKDYISDDSFDPSKLLSTDKFGVAPGNTTLRVAYRKNNTDNVNAATDTVTEVVSPDFEFANSISLDSAKLSEVMNSLEITNESPITGDVSAPSSTELKRRIMDVYASQNRAVTKQDYKSVVYQMPPQFGAVKRVNLIQDNDSFKRNLNMYVISEDQSGVLTETAATIKNNLKVWLNKNKMINDTIDILDAKIVNIGIEFEVIAESEQNKYSALKDASDRLRELFEDHMDISEPFSITKIYSTLNGVDGIADVVNVRIKKMVGADYSSTRFDIEENTSPDGRYISVPDDVILEIKYPRVDIIGSTR